MLRLDDAAVTHAVLHAVAFAPAVYRVPPATQRVGVRLEAGLFNHGNQLDEHILDITNDGDVHLHPLGDT